MSRRILYALAACSLIVLLLIGSFASFGVSAAQVQRTPRATRTPVQITPRTTLSNTGYSLTATALVSKVRSTATALSKTATAFGVRSTKLPGDEASLAITTYGQEVLGISVAVIEAGGVSYDVSRSISQTSESADAQSAVVNLAVKSYAATFKNGAATLSYGAGTISGDVTIDVQGSSLGVYSLYVTGTGTLTADTALALATKTFPNLAGLTYTPYTVSKGYEWYTRSDVPSIDPKTRQIVDVAQTVILYVLPGANGRATITATVGRGDYASTIAKP